MNDELLVMKKKIISMPNILLAISMIIILILRIYIFEIVKVSGDSMYPTLKDGQLIFLWKPISTLSRGDIVVFTSPDETELIKRVIGLPGENIEIENGIVYIENIEMDEKYQFDSTPPDSISEILISTDSVFVMGDNRNFSEDSRKFGTIPYQLIKGKLIFVIG